MHTYQDLKAKFPGCYSVGAEVIARIDNENVVVAELGNGSFNLTKKGQELMGAPQVKVTAEVKAEVIKPAEPKTRGQKTKAKVAPAETPPEVTDSLDDILAE